MRRIKTVLVLLTLLALLVSCKINSELHSITDEPISQTSDIQHEPLSLLGEFPELSSICPYDEDRVLVVQKGNVILYNIVSLTREKEFATLPNAVLRLGKLEQQKFCYKDGSDIIFLDEELLEINRFRIVENIENNKYSVSPSGSSLAYLSGDYHLKLLPEQNGQPVDLGEVSMTFMFLNDSCLIAADPYGEETSYQLISINTGERETFSTTSFIPKDVSGNLLGEALISGEFASKDMVRIIDGKNPENPFRDIAVGDGESDSVCLSNSGNFVLSYMSHFDEKQIPSDNVQLTLYDTKSGQMKWRKSIAVPRQTIYVYKAFYFEESNSLLFLVSEDYEDRRLKDAYLLRLLFY